MLVMHGYATTQPGKGRAVIPGYGNNTNQEPVEYFPQTKTTGHAFFTSQYEITIVYTHENTQLFHRRLCFIYGLRNYLPMDSTVHNKHLSILFIILRVVSPAFFRFLHIPAHSRIIQITRISIS